MSLGLLRLFNVRRKCAKAFKKLCKLFNNKTKARAVLFRLTDKEIYNFSKMKLPQILQYFEKKKNESIRIKMIYLSYFKNVSIIY